jgi:hypothetical protein
MKSYCDLLVNFVFNYYSITANNFKIMFKFNKIIIKNIYVVTCY